MPSYYIVLERTIPNFDVYVNGNMLAKRAILSKDWRKRAA